MEALRYAARPSAVLKYFGQLGFVFGLMTVVPTAVAVISADYGAALRYGIVVAAALLCGGLLSRLPAPRRLQTNEAMAVSAMIFLFSALVTAWPATTAGLNYTDALFETVSGVTTTGLTVTSAVEDKPLSFLFGRAWLQWVGGLGIVVLSLTALIQPGLTAKRLGDLEAHGDDLVGGTRAYARRILTAYAALTVFGIALLGLFGIGWGNAVFYAFAAVSTGGFSPHTDSLAGLGGYGPSAAVIFLSLVGGVPLVLYHRSAVNDRWALVRNGQMQGMLALGVTVGSALALILWLQQSVSWPQALYHGLMNAFSAQSTAGFSTVGIAGLDPGAKVVLILSMMVGGSAGSTAGGVKIVRLFILARLLFLMVRRSGMPRQAVAHARLDGQRLEAEEIQNALCLFLAFIVFTALSWLPFVAMGHPPLDSLFEVVSAIGTVGLSAGVCGPDLHPFLKGVLCADMLMGRLEILAWLVLVYPGTWLGNRLEG